MSKAHHRSRKPGALFCQRRAISISTDAYEKIDEESKQQNMSKIKTVDAIVKFYFNNYIIVEQLSLISKRGVV